MLAPTLVFVENESSEALACASMVGLADSSERTWVGREVKAAGDRAMARMARIISCLRGWVDITLFCFEIIKF